MQTEYLHSKRYYQVDKVRVSLLRKEGLFRFDALARFEQAMRGGLYADDAAVVVGVPRSTLFRWRAHKAEQLERLNNRSRRPRRFRKPQDRSRVRRRIEQLREEHPTWGKRKITRLLEREKETVKQSTVGRIISALIRGGVIASAKQAAMRAGRRQPRPKRPYAMRLRRGEKLKADQPGHAVQVDHMTVQVQPGEAVKHFNAVCTVSRWNVAEAYSRATATTASLFIDKVIKDMPFPVTAIQVDGGSEFMAEFEEACLQRRLQLHVLAPKSPELNGYVERINGTWRTDFYEQYDLPHNLEALRPLLADYQDTYNWDRPHDGLGLQTPQEFLQASNLPDRVPQSQMS
jgi:putative transposase